MKKAAILLAVALQSLFVMSCSSESFMNIGSAVSSVAVGYVTGAINESKNLSDEDKKTLNEVIVPSLTKNSSYVNAGKDFWNGKKNSAIINLTEGATRNVPGMERICAIQRAVNQYNEDIKNGVDPAVALEKKNNAIGENSAKFYFETKERRSKVLIEEREKKLQVLYDAIRGRGYSDEEALMYSYLLYPEIKDYDESDSEYINRLLNNYNIQFKDEPSTTGTFFGEPATPSDLPKGTMSHNNVPIVVKPVNTPPAKDPYIIDVEQVSQTVVSQYKYLGHKLTDDQKSELDKIAAFMQKWPNAKVTIVGHTCSIGKHDDNMRLGLRRAHQAKVYLIEQGIDENRISEDSKAAELPCASNDTEEGRLQNRRITFVIE